MEGENGAESGEPPDRIGQEDLSILFDETSSQQHSDDVLLVAESYFEEYERRGFGEHLAEIFHENTKNSMKNNEDATIRSAQKFNESDLYKYVVSRSPDRSENPTVELPEPDPPDMSISDALARRRSRRNLSGEPISLEALSTLLRYSLGVNREAPIGLEAPNGEPIEQGFRTYPSGGALYPVEIYLLIVGVDDLAPGVYYYKPEEHVLRVLKEDPDIEQAIGETFTALDQLDPRDAAVTLVFTSVFWRAMAKYGPRGYRYILQESGHMAQNVHLVAEAMDLAATPNGGMMEHHLDPYLDLDGVNESSLYSITIGKEDHHHE